MNKLQRMETALRRMSHSQPLLAQCGGRIKDVSQSSYRVEGLQHVVKLGDLVEVHGEGRCHLGEVIRISRDHIVVKPFDTAGSIGIDALTWHRGRFGLWPHSSWRGRTLDALARPVDEGPPLQSGDTEYLTDSDPPNALKRARISSGIRTGVRVIDIFTPLCVGQRIGIFAGSGVGKSTLLSMLSRPQENETVVIALIGERGREVREFLEALDPETRERTVAVISTGDQSALMRRLAAHTAVTIAEYFRDIGENVLLIVDSITRYAHAAREIALSAGELPVARGFTPSVFSDLPRLLERAGPAEGQKGAITGIFSVLVDGDDHNDPVADCIRGTLDGHIVLQRALAEQGRYPAVNPLSSVSRLANLAWTTEQAQLVTQLRAMLSLYEDTKDLRLLGGYKEGTDPALDNAVKLAPRIIQAMKQSPLQPQSTDAFAELAQLMRNSP